MQKKDMFFLTITELNRCDTVSPLWHRMSCNLLDNQMTVEGRVGAPTCLYRNTYIENYNIKFDILIVEHPKVQKCKKNHFFLTISELNRCDTVSPL
jgi:hypothetical protein